MDDTPLEAGLGFTCRLKQRGEGSEFIGRKALEEQLQRGISKRLVCFTLDKYSYNTLFICDSNNVQQMYQYCTRWSIHTLKYAAVIQMHYLLLMPLRVGQHLFCADR